jgi:adenylyltransferase/sulfurtransferase
MNGRTWRDRRYDRQEAIPDFGAHGQKLIRSSRVAVIGAGGVKSPLLFYLAAVGVGHLRIIDYDRVELSNLNRQILYTVGDIGRYKAEAAAKRLTELNPAILIEPVVTRLTSDNFSETLDGCDLVFEGGDSLGARLAFNREALVRRMIYIHASAQYNYAYVLTVVPFVSACMECVYGDLPVAGGGAVPVIGCATGVAGTVAACEAVNILTQRGPAFAGRMWQHEGWTGQTIITNIQRQPNCHACGDRFKLNGLAFP